MIPLLPTSKISGSLRWPPESCTVSFIGLGGDVVDPIKLLAQQIQQYNEQNQREHNDLKKDIKQILAEVHALYGERNTDQAINNDRFSRLEAGISTIQEDLKEIKDQNMKRDHLFKSLLKALGAASVIGGLIATAIKFNLF